MPPEFWEQLKQQFQQLMSAEKAPQKPGSDTQYAFLPMDGYVSKLRES